LQIDTLSLPSLPAGSNVIGKVDVNSLPSIPAGTNNIGDVDVLTLPSIPAGANNIGDVDVLTLPQIPAGINNIGTIGNLSYRAGAWYKQPLIDSISTDWGDLKTNLSLPAGNSNQDHAAMPANAWTIVTNWAVKYVGTITNVYLDLVRMDAGTGGIARQIMGWKIATSNIWYYWTGSFVCKPTDVLRVVVTGATLNDDLYSSINGHYFFYNL
jgi:hypothetical protein